MPLITPLLFHFNQHLTEYALLASKVCYTGLLDVLLHAPLKTNIHISGTLIQALQWLDPAPLNKIREGIEQGAFELVGSTHAQNVPYATDDRDNAAQIQLHQEIIWNTFGVRPTTFWNPERCWRQSLVPVIADAGYRTMTIEDHILDATGRPVNELLATGYDGRNLKIVRDDAHLKDRFNFAAWFGDPEPLLRYLQDLQSRKPGAAQYLAYAEDAEAMGLWGYHRGVIPQQTFDRLAHLLEVLAASSWFKAAHFRDLPDSSEYVENIPDGAAGWMDASLKDPERPYHEDGYSDWFDFNRRSEKLAHFRSFYSHLREELDRFRPLNGPRMRLHALAQHTFLTHQYEFGCIGIGSHDTHIWRGAESSRVIAALAQISEADKTSVEAVTGKDAVVHIAGSMAALVSLSGGRMMFWMDRDSGTLMVGNPSAVPFGPYGSLTTAPQEIAYPARWVPDGSSYRSYDSPEAPPTRMKRFLPDAIWNDYTQPITLATREMRIHSEYNRTRPIKIGAFYDDVRLAGTAIFSPSTPMQRSGSALTSDLQNGIQLEKQLELHGASATMHYTLTAPADCSLQFRTAAEIAGDYEAVLRKGREAVDFAGENAIRLNGSGAMIRLSASVPGSLATHREGLLALILEVELNLTLRAGEPHGFSVSLQFISP